MTPHLRDTVALLDRLVAYPTMSSDSNLDLINDLANRLDSNGARVEVSKDATGKKANLYASIGPERAGGLVLSGHTDVVPVTDQTWQSDPFTLTRRDDTLFGRGTCDMKGFIAAATTLAPLFAQANLSRPVHFAFTYDEEIGCFGARALVAELALRDDRPAMALIGEPTSMQIIDGHKGCYEYTTHICGLEGHGSQPDKGVNAAEYAARYVSCLLALREELQLRAPAASPFDPPWTTLNIGAIRAGVAHNVVAGRAEIDWEMRPVQASDADYVKDTLRVFADASLLPAMRAVHPPAGITLETIGEVVGLNVMADNAARDLIAELTGANGTQTVSFGTEAGLFQSLGMSVAICGPGSIDQAHKADEFVSLDQLNRCLSLLEQIPQALAN